MLKERIQELVSACFTGIWIESHENHEAIAEIRSLCREQDWRLAIWDIDRGLDVGNGENVIEGGDPLAAIRALSALDSNEETSILLMNNLHKFDRRACPSQDFFEEALKPVGQLGN